MIVRLQSFIILLVALLALLNYSGVVFTQKAFASTSENSDTADTFSIKANIDMSAYGRAAPCNLGPDTDFGPSALNPEQNNPSVVFVMGQPPLLWRLSGDWDMVVENGVLTNFTVNFSMSSDTEPEHIHTITDFVPVGMKNTNKTVESIQLKHNGVTIINGTVDFKQTCHDKLPNIPASIEIYPQEKKVTLRLLSDQISRHFATESDTSNKDVVLIYGEIKQLRENDEKTVT